MVSELVSEVRLRARFTLKRKDYSATVSKIHQNNELLSRLVEHSTSFEPTRRANSQAKFARTIRTLAHGLFSSLCDAISCQCVGSHRVGLHLMPRTASRVAGEDEDLPQGNAVSFDMIFGVGNDYDKRRSMWEGLSIRWQREENTLPEQTSHASIDTSRSLESLSLTDQGGSGQKGKGKSSLGAGLEGVWSKTLRRSPSPAKPERHPKVRFSIPTTVDSTDDASSTKSGCGTVTL